MLGVASCRAGAIVWIAVVLAIGAADAHAEQRFALVIGANAGWMQDRPLRYAEQDAERVRDVLVSLGGFAADRVELARDPDTAEVRAALRRLATIAHDSTTEDTLVFVYYSGHADEQNLHLRGAPLSHQELKETLRGLPATIRVAVIDACKSGAVVDKGGRAVSDFKVDLFSPKLSGVVLLSSSGADELSQESHEIAGSVFTHHLVSGLRGAADADADQQVTLAEAYHYAYERTRADSAIHGTQQRPAFRFELTGQGDLVLARITAPRTAQLRVSRGAAQRYVILDAHEWRLIAEAERRLDGDVVLALAPGSYRVKRVFADRLETAAVTLAPGDVIGSDRLTYTSAPLSGGMVKGEPIDLSPFERHEWARARAFGVLANGDAAEALALFKQLLHEAPGDMLAGRGLARAQIRMAEAYQRVNDTAGERTALDDALHSDPSLSDDPLFQIWYRRIGEIAMREQHAADERASVNGEIRNSPRIARRLGIAADVVSARGFVAVGASATLRPAFAAGAALDLAYLGLDVVVTFAPLPSRWSPFLGLGAHVSAKKLGFDISASNFEKPASMNGHTGDEIYGAHVRLEFGAQYIGRTGFTAELGWAVMALQDKAGAIAQDYWPVLHFGWIW